MLGPVVTVSKQFGFHAAHRLPHHDGPCRRLHGHSYKLEVAVTGHVQKPGTGSSEGMVLDFAILKAIYEDRIEPRVEHQNLNDTLEDVLPHTPADEEQVGEPLTTSEHMAQWMWSEFEDALFYKFNSEQAEHLRVRLWETPTSWAEVEGSI